jgi:hypothetical protein
MVAAHNGPGVTACIDCVFSRGVVAVDVSTRASIWLSYEQTHLRLNGWYVALI